MKRLVPVLLIAACAFPHPAPQNPSPMVDSVRSHERVQQRAIEGTRLAIHDILPKPVDILVTPHARGAPDP